MTYTCTITTKRSPINKDGSCSRNCPMHHEYGGANWCPWCVDVGDVWSETRPGKRCPWKAVKR